MKRRASGMHEPGGGVLGPREVELQTEAAAVRTGRVGAVADHERMHFGLAVLAHVKERRALGRAHPLVAVPGVVGGAEGVQGQGQHAGGVSAVHQRVDSALRERPHQAFDGEHEPGGARHVIEDGQTGARGRGREDGGRHLLRVRQGEGHSRRHHS